MNPSLISHQQYWHATCCFFALLGCLPLLWPGMLPQSWQASASEYAGEIILASVLVSLTVLGTTSLSMLLRLRNLHTLVHLTFWAMQWFLTCCIFALLAYFADIPAPTSPQTNQAIVRRDPPPLPPTDYISGPTSLVVPISIVDAAPTAISQAPYLSSLEEQHPTLLRDYINKSPRWAASLSDQTFYTKPWHVVMILQNPRIGPGFVHAAFLRLTDGEQLPAGYTVVNPGGPLPVLTDSETQIPDLALDLGGAHYLLLAWRGAGDPQLAFCALNAAIHEVDEMVRPLANRPDQPTLSLLINGSTNPLEEDPETPVKTDILLSEPQAQSGCFQAQILANPGEKGVFLLSIRNASSGEQLLCFEIPARFSYKSGSIFRHDIPADLPTRLRQVNSSNIIPNNAPLFMIPCTSKATSFDVLFELSFRPAAQKKAYHVLSKIYRLASYNNPNGPSAKSIKE